MEIPKKFKLFGYDIDVEYDENLQENHDALGLTLFNKNKILLLPNDPNKPRPEIQIEKHFLHELIHWILYVMDEETLTCNEKFVDLFARLLQQALSTMEYNK